MSKPTNDDLYVNDLHAAMTVCGVFDPGQDESNDPDDFPADNDKDE